jgi:putative endonuclease
MQQSFVYILFSNSLNKYYVGLTTLSPEERLERHISNFYSQKKKYTEGASDWELFWKLSCASVGQARRIERHIKKMKSRAYIENLIKYPEISRKLLNRFTDLRGGT